MKITWLKHPFSPELNGVSEHVARSVAESALQFKQAVLAPRPPYGSSAWLEERAEAARNAVPDKNDTVITPVVGKVWCLMTTAQERSLLVLKSGFETTYFADVRTALAAGCPKKIADQFVPEEKRKSDREAAAERAEQAKWAAEAQAKKDNARAEMSKWR